VALVTALTGLGGAALAQTAAPQVPTAVLGAATDGQGFALTGSIQAVQQVTLAAQAQGNVVQLAVKAGDQVRRGQLLARIDARATQAGVRAAQAGVAQAEAQLENARQQLQRTLELRGQGFISQAAVDGAEAQFRTAMAALDQARAGQAQATLANTFTTAIAPFDGVVLATHVEAGELASPGMPLLTVYAPGAMRAVVEVPASRQALAQAATRTTVRLPSGNWVTPTQRQPLPAADPVSQTVEWRLPLAAADAAALAPGQSIQVRFEAAAGASASANARPRVPLQAVLQRGELTAVYTVIDGRFVLRPVRLGAESQADGAEILAGLRPGDRYALDAVRAGLAGAAPASAR
jgi:RND family efflux transporter MFP subunit